MKLTEAQRRALEILREQGRPVGWGCYGSRPPGVNHFTAVSLWSRGLVDANGLTAKGRAALA